MGLRGKLPGGAFDGAAVKLPVCPKHLDKEARAEWRRIGRELVQLGRVTAVDRAALASYCVAWSRWVASEAEVSRLGAVVKTANGNLIQNPYLAIANRALEQLNKVAHSFGLTPISRARLPAAAAQGEMSLAEMLFADTPLPAGDK